MRSKHLKTSGLGGRICKTCWLMKWKKWGYGRTQDGSQAVPEIRNTGYRYNLG